MAGHHSHEMHRFRRTAALAAVLYCGAAVAAEDHTAEVLEHAGKAAAARDSASIGEHAKEALKHMGSVKAAHGTDPEALKHIRRGEAELKAADQNARWFNTDAAVEHAESGKAHLEAIDK